MVLLACGAVVSMKHSLADLRQNIVLVSISIHPLSILTMRIYSEDKLFVSILGFNKDSFLPHKTVWLLAEYTMLIFVHEVGWDHLMSRLLNNH
jgi:hypothetical protein